MIKWKNLESETQLNALIERSNDAPCLIFKHSTTCHISAMVRARLEQNWDFDAAALEPYYIDLLRFRSVSDAVAEHFDVFHESPQVLLVRDGECVYDASHLDISMAELHNIYAD